MTARPCPMCGADLLDGKHQITAHLDMPFLVCPQAPPGVVTAMNTKYVHRCDDDCPEHGWRAP